MELDEARSAERLRVLHVVECFAAGVKTALLQYIASTPMVEHIVVANNRGEPLPDVDPGYRLISMESGHYARIRQIERLCKKLSPSLVHAHSSYAGIYTRLSRIGVPVVYTPHCFAFERRDVAAPVRAMLWLIERGLAVKTSVVAACSYREARLARQMSKSVELVPNVGRFESVDFTRSGEEPHETAARVVFLGRLSAQKDPRFAMEMVRDLRRIVADGVDAEWIGDGRQEIRHELADAGIRVSGWMDADDVSAELASCSIYVHTGAWEGFPMAILEASQLGRPIAARAIPAMERMPQDYLGDSPSQLARIVAATLRSSERREECSARWANVLAVNTRENQREALLGVYDRVADCRTRGSMRWR
ncbi:glycosyltransferase [Acidipropionibacterium virtanenii]|uniref:Glycosyltransferase subfamily 4-like N-terminal domain-containing protein n=1 Tax=Acidipropionibacterium virtanenii TaxID=2057246 RepID=A0A344UX62_9ACTN|nr:glycosyltransferase [Acidipropionibacterium virtanenii]AXE39860.1 hypothetical protein JS278_02725 [Acidipropionibacterium virtanenii]